MVARAPSKKISFVVKGFDFTDIFIALIKQGKELSEVRKLVFKAMEERKEQIKDLYRDAIELQTGVEWKAVSAQVSVPRVGVKAISRSMRLERSYIGLRRNIINNVTNHANSYKTALKYLEEGNFAYLKKYGVTPDDDKIQALIKINKQVREEALQSSKKYADYHIKRLVTTESVDIKTQAQKEWVDAEVGRELIIKPHPSYCSICAPYVFKKYPTEIKLLPPYHPNCRCNATRI